MLCPAARVPRNKEKMLLQYFSSTSVEGRGLRQRIKLSSKLALAYFFHHQNEGLPASIGSTSLHGILLGLSL